MVPIFFFKLDKLWTIQAAAQIFISRYQKTSLTVPYLCTEVQKQSCTNKRPNEELTLLALYWALLLTFQRNADQTFLVPHTPIKNTENLLLQGSEWSLYISLHSCRLHHKIRHKPPLCKLSIKLWINFHNTAKCLLGEKKERKKGRKETTLHQRSIIIPYKAEPQYMPYTAQMFCTQYSNDKNYTLVKPND